jgi:para-nitrobenzyl esterase
MLNRRSFIGTGTLVTAGMLADRSWAGMLAQNTKVAPGATVETTAGRVRGLLVNGVQTFKGVSYGASTAGAARFLPPSKPSRWPGVKETVALGPRAPQVYGGEPPEVAAMDLRESLGEDCLCLNLWTPATNRGKRPVMLWLHGGGYASGSGGFIIYDGRELARKHDVVAISINHRLNVFGFLYLAGIGGEKYATASNGGMLDIVAALEWVRDNVAAFGGDPGNVTIFGQSGGAGKVCTLMAMPAAKGLFHRAIVQSGSAIQGIPPAAAIKTAETLLSRLGVSKTRLDELHAIPVEKLIAAIQNPDGSPGFGPGSLTLGPVVDGKSLPTDPFHPAAPDLSTNIPVLIGSTATEVTFFPFAKLDPLDDATLQTRIKETLKVDDAKAEEVIAIYRKAKPRDNLDLFNRLSTDASQFRRGVETVAERKAAQEKAPVYMYRFEWYSPVREGKMGAYHCLEIPFVFDNVHDAQAMTGSGPERQALADKMSAAWVAFARSGNPNHGGLPTWRPFTATERATMVFDNECKAVNDPHRDARLALAAIRAASSTQQ